MPTDQLLIVSILAATMLLFIVNIWRYDIVSGSALMACVYTGIVPIEKAFEGFSHPAVITVACVLVISKALQSSGVVELFLRYLAYTRSGVKSQIAANAGITAVLSAFMNNIGALALMLPVTIRDAVKAKRNASVLLMPLSFASLLGGLTTLIGTPPNIIVATFRENNAGEAFSMFDFTRVGLVTALAGIAFLVLIGWRLLPRTRTSNEGVTNVHHQFARYITELRLPAGSALINQTVGDLEKFCENEISVTAIFRNQRRRLAPSYSEKLYEDDTLIIEGDSAALQPLLEDPGMVIAGAEEVDTDWLRSPDVRIIEAVLMPNSVVEGIAMREAEIHQRYSVNLLGVAREGRASRALLKHVRFKTGDVLLLQGEPESLKLACKNLGCLAIKNRGIEFSTRRGSLITPGIFAAGIAATATGLVPAQIAFATVVGLLVVLRMVSLQEAYNSIEWPIIVLLGFLIPVGEALQTTGAAQTITVGVLENAAALPAWAVIASIMVISMLLSDLVHNTPTAVLMCPIAFSLAGSLGYSPDAFLMAVAVGAASPYLTPIGHQSNTLVMGPGGYRFSDYWRMGLPLDFVIVSVATPMIVWVWL